MNLAGQGTRLIRPQNGYAMAALLVGLTVMSVLMSMALPVWSHMVKREKEEELIWRGEQYKRAIMLFQRKFANTFPPTVNVLVEQRFLRRKYKDPITNDDFQLLPAGGGTPSAAAALGTPGGTQQPGQVPGRPTGAGRGGPTLPSGFSGGRATLPGGATTATQAQIPGVGTLNVGIGGVVSKSKDTSIKIYNGRQKYNEWAFVYLQTAQRVVAPGGAQSPGMPVPPGPLGRGGPSGFGGPGGRGGFPGDPAMPPNTPSGRPAVPFGQPVQPGQPPFGSPFGPMNPQQRPPQRPPGL